MNHFYKASLGLTVAFFALPLAAQASEYLEVKPGEWSYEFTYEFGGQVVDSKTETYCLTPEESRRTIASLIEEVKEDGSCEISNLVHKDNRLSADAVCLVKELGMTADGTISAQYSDTHYDVEVEAMLDMGRLQLPATATAWAKRLGDCKAP